MSGRDEAPDDLSKQAREAYLDKILIGGREEKPRIVIVDYDASWSARFEVERAKVSRALGSTAIGIEHIGSAAVPGLAAKPIMDLLVSVADPEDDARIVPALESAGYQLRVRGDPGPGGRLGARPPRGQDATHGRDPC